MENELLRFICNDTNFAFDVSEIREITNITNLTDIPDAPDSIMGLALVRGEPVTVIDLPHLLFGTTSDTGSDSATVLLCSSVTGTYAMYVHSVSGIIRVTEKGIPPTSIIGNDSFVKEYFCLNTDIIMRLDTNQILERVSKS